MSRLGKKPVPIADSVAVTVDRRTVRVKGAKGSLELNLPSGVAVTVEDSPKQVVVNRENDVKQSRANHGLTRSLISNMVQGVTEGFQKRLLIYGTGYNCKLEGRTLHLNIGHMGRRHGVGAQFELPVPEGVEIDVETPAARGDSEPAKLLVRGCDKQVVGQFAAEIRALRKAEPYKGKGIRYDDEVVRRKQGKTVTGG